MRTHPKQLARNHGGPSVKRSEAPPPPVLRSWGWGGGGGEMEHQEGERGRTGEKTGEKRRPERRAEEERAEKRREEKRREEKRRQREEKRREEKEKEKRRQKHATQRHHPYALTPARSSDEHVGEVLEPNSRQDAKVAADRDAHRELNRVLVHDADLSPEDEVRPRDSSLCDHGSTRSRARYLVRRLFTGAHHRVRHQRRCPSDILSR